MGFEFNRADFNAGGNNGIYGNAADSRQTQAAGGSRGGTGGAAAAGFLGSASNLMMFPSEGMSLPAAALSQGQGLLSGADGGLESLLSIIDEVMKLVMGFLKNINALVNKPENVNNPRKSVDSPVSNDNHPAPNIRSNNCNNNVGDTTNYRPWTDNRINTGDQLDSNFNSGGRLDDIANPGNRLDSNYQPKGVQEQGNLFVKGADDKSAISSNDISQGSIGDCYFLSSLATIADQHPEIIEKNLKDNGNGTYTATFYGRNGAPQNVTVSAREFLGNSSHGGDTNRSGQKEVWVRAYEAAYAKFKGYNDMVNGGGQYEAMHDLIGNAANNIRRTNNTSFIEDALSAGKLATVRTDGRGYDRSGIQSAMGLVPYHIYSIKAVSGDSVTLYNPWGRDVTMSRSQFARAFGSQHVEVYV